MVPERIAGSARDLVVGDDEVSHILIFGVRLKVILLDVGSRESRGWEHREKPVDRGLNEMNAGRLERLEEAGREANRDDVLVPRLEPPTGSEAHRSRVGERFAVEIGEKRLAHLLVADQVGRIDI